MLTGEKCYLRAIEPSDIDQLYEWENDETIWPEGSGSQPVAQFGIEQLIAQADMDIYQTRQLRLMICDVETRTSVGCIDLFDFDPFNMHGSIGVMVDSKFQRHGYASDAMSVFVDYLFGTLHIHALAVSVRNGNVASLRLFDKCGFGRVGERKDWVRTAAGYENEILMQKVSD